MKRGWCPTVHAPMPSGDGLLVRVKPFGGRLPAAALRDMAAAVAAYGNGTVELTGRGNLQVRGVRDPVAFARAMVASGLADPDPAREARRNVLAIPPCDPALVALAEAVLSRTPGLPPKAGVVVTEAGIHVGDAVVRDADALARLLPGAPAPVPPLPALPNLLHLPFGQLDAATLDRLAAATPEVRTTPWRALWSATPVPGFETPGSIAACPGGPACASGTVAARRDAAVLQARGFARLHVSGCAKGCAHPAPALTLVGRNGRYDLVRHGRASDPPERTGLSLDEAMAAL